MLELSVDLAYLLKDDSLMGLSPDNQSDQNLMSSEQVTGAKIGFVIITIISACVILGMVFPVFCPHTYDKIFSALKDFIGDTNEM